MELNDVVLLERIAERDCEAFRIFFDRYAPMVLGHLCRLLPQRQAAEDVLQETFCQVWRQAEKFQAERSSARMWLFLIARSRAIDFLRKQRSSTSLDSIPEKFTVSLPDMVEMDERARSVVDALRDLPSEQRQALLLVFYEGFTHHEVADYQTVPLGTAKTRIRLAMKRLRDSLKQYQDN